MIDWMDLLYLVVVHPVEHDLRGAVPPRGHVPAHSQAQ